MDTLIILAAKYLVFVMVLILLGLWLLSDRKIRWQFAATIVLSGLIALALSRLASKLYYDPRPFAVANIKPLVAQEANNGFPSDHMLLASTLTALTYLYNRPIGKLMLVLALLVGLGRIGAHVHTPIDIAGSFVISAFGVWIGYRLAKRLVPGGQQTTGNQ